jgi:hypothetical protein
MLTRTNNPQLIKDLQTSLENEALFILRFEILMNKINFYEEEILKVKKV